MSKIIIKPFRPFVPYRRKWKLSNELREKFLESSRQCIGKPRIRYDICVSKVREKIGDILKAGVGLLSFEEEQKRAEEIRYAEIKRKIQPVILKHLFSKDKIDIEKTTDYIRKLEKFPKDIIEEEQEKIVKGALEDLADMDLAEKV